MRYRLGAAFVLLALLGAFACGRNHDRVVAPPPPADDSEAPIRAALTADTSFIFDATFEREDGFHVSQEQNPKGAGIRRDTQGAVSDIEFVGSTATYAEVDIIRRIWGRLWRYYDYDVPGYEVDAWGDMPFFDRWRRRVVLERATPEDPWRLASLATIHPTDTLAAGPRILGLKIHSGSANLVITDPAQLWQVDQLSHLVLGDWVRVTVLTAAPDDLVSLLVVDELATVSRSRRRLEPIGDGTYSVEWQMGGSRGRQHIGVSALSHQTVYGPEEKYLGDAWLVPVVVD